MLVVPCPRCGRPNRLSLAAPERLLCPACSYDGPPPGDATARLREAGAILSAVDVGRRQLDAGLKRALGTAGGLRRRYLRIFLLSSLPVSLFALALLAVTAAAKVLSAGVLPFALVPVAGAIASGLVGRAWVRKAERRLEQSCAAVPPATQGEPITCHVCGGPLATGADAFARCAFCSADNLVDRRILEQIRRADRAAVTNVAGAVALEAAAVGSAAASASWAIRICGIAVPLACFFGVGLAYDALAATFAGPPDASVEYVVRQTRHGQCLAALTRGADGSAILDFGAAWPSGDARREEVASVSGLQVVDASWIVGKRLCLAGGHVCGTVSRVYSLGAADNRFDVPDAPRTRRSPTIPGNCLGR